MTIAEGRIGKIEYHLLRDIPASEITTAARRQRKQRFFDRDENSIWLWAFGLELVVSRQR